MSGTIRTWIAMILISGPTKVAFLNQPGQADIQSDLFYDYRTNVDAYPKWQAWMREKQPRLLVIWGKYDLSFELSEPEAYRRDVPKAEVHILDAGHFALDTAAAEIAALVRNFIVACDRGALFVAGLFLGDSLLLRSLVPLVPGGRGPAFAMANAGLRLVGVRNANAIDGI
jgi:hypothetical protein